MLKIVILILLTALFFWPESVFAVAVPCADTDTATLSLVPASGNFISGSEYNEVQAKLSISNSSCNISYMDVIISINSGNDTIISGFNADSGALLSGWLTSRIYSANKTVSLEGLRPRGAYTLNGEILLGNLLINAGNWTSSLIQPTLSFSINSEVIATGGTDGINLALVGTPGNYTISSPAPSTTPAPYTIGGDVFIDNSNPPNGYKDGASDPPDNGNGVTIKLKRDSSILNSKHPDSEGKYEFTNLPSLPSPLDTYTIDFTLPLGYTAHGDTPETQEISNTTPNKTSINMALIPPSTPTVTNFTITPSPNPMTQGVPTRLTLNWNIANANACELRYYDGAHWRVPINIDPGVGVSIGATPGDNSKSFSFTSPINTGGQVNEYAMRIQCTNLIRQSSASNDVTVTANPPPIVPTVCTSFTPEGLNEKTDEFGSRGEKIYVTADSTGGGTRRFEAVWAPSTARFIPTATGLTFAQAEGSTTNWVSTIPDNPSTTANVDYRVTSTASLGSVSVPCASFIIRVPKKPIDTVCPAGVTTQAKFLLSGTTWSTAKTITLGDTVKVGGFHGNQTTAFASDTLLSATGPEGSTSSTEDLNNLDDTILTNDNNVPFIPTSPGKYTVVALVKGKTTGAGCVGQATLTVSPVTVVTSNYRISETPFNKTDATPAWSTYPPASGQPFAFNFETPSIGGNLSLYAQFKTNTGEISDVFSKTIKYIGPDPVITNIACNFDSSTGTGSKVTLIGRNFGQQGQGGVKVISGTGSSNAVISSWGSFVPSSSLPPAGDVGIGGTGNVGIGTTGNVGIGTTGNVGTGTTGSSQTVERIVATINERLSGNANVELTLDDGRKITRSCTVNTTTVSFNTLTQCVLPGNFSATNVRVQIAEDVSGARPLFDSRTTPITLDAQGLPQWTPPALEIGKTYNLIIKTPKSLAVSQKFTVSAGTNVLDDILFPVGDIAPVTAPDGTINALDKAELNRQWNISNDTARIGDFNIDGRVNSIDYSCMRQNINAGSSGVQFLR